MPPNLSVPLRREFALSVILKDAATVLQTILNMPSPPRFTLTIPPGVKGEVKDPTGQMLGEGFSGVYVGLDDPKGIYVAPEDGDVQADIGVIVLRRRTPEEGPWVYFAGGRSKTSKALIAALAIAVAERVGSDIADYSGHWMPQDMFTANDLLHAMTGSSAFDNCR